MIGHHALGHTAMSLVGVLIWFAKSMVTTTKESVGIDVVIILGLVSLDTI